MAVEWGGTSSGTKCKRCSQRLTGLTSETVRIPIGVMGYGEGGLILSALLRWTRDRCHRGERYFRSAETPGQSRSIERVGSGPRIGDAEMPASLRPRGDCRSRPRPEVDGRPALRGKRKMSHVQWKAEVPPLDSVQREVDRTRPIFAALGWATPSASDQ